MMIILKIKSYKNKTLNHIHTEFYVNDKISFVNIMKLLN